MEGAEIGPVNIGNPVENTIREIADIIIAKVCARVCVRVASRATLWILIRVRVVAGARVNVTDRVPTIAIG